MQSVPSNKSPVSFHTIRLYCDHTAQVEQARAKMQNFHLVHFQVMMKNFTINHLNLNKFK